jgi:hypothetical protein
MQKPRVSLAAFFLKQQKGGLGGRRKSFVAP